tara:strand:+ start:86 stop:1237 length:1152 start_codon:yes stop_codon:yes gene_type:complete
MNIFKKLFGKNSHLQEGENEVYYPNGKLKERGVILNGEKSGNWEFFYENGNRKGEQEYVHGKIQGTGKYYYEDGKLRLLGHYEDGKSLGLSRLYDPQGRVRSYMSLSYDEEGRKFGLHMNLHKNNKLLSYGQTLNGKDNGTWYFFDERELLISQKEFRNGELVNINEDPIYLGTIETIVRKSNPLNRYLDSYKDEDEEKNENILNLTKDDISNSVKRVTGRNPSVVEVGDMTTFMFKEKDSKDEENLRLVEPEFFVSEVDVNLGKFRMDVIVEGQLIEEWYNDDSEEIKYRRNGYRIVLKTKDDESGKIHIEILHEFKNNQRDGLYMKWESYDWRGPEKQLVESGFYTMDKKDGEFFEYGPNEKVFSKELFDRGELISSEVFD